MTTQPKKYTANLRVWINEESGHFLGRGRVKLLESIGQTGSITHGAEAMKMSYRQAWQMVQDMNRLSEKPLVEKILGGKGGGGARVTEAGKRVIALFYELEEKIARFSKEQADSIDWFGDEARPE